MNAHNLPGTRKYQNNYNSGMFDPRMGDGRDRNRNRSKLGRRDAGPVTGEFTGDNGHIQRGEEWQMRSQNEPNDFNRMDGHRNQNVMAFSDNDLRSRNRNGAYERNYPSSYNNATNSGRYHSTPLTQTAVSGTMDVPGANAEWKLLPPRTNDARNRYEMMPPHNDTVPTTQRNGQNHYKPLAPDEMSLDPVHRARQIREAMIHRQMGEDRNRNEFSKRNGNFVHKEDVGRNMFFKRDPMHKGDVNYFDEDVESIGEPNGGRGYQTGFQSQGTNAANTTWMNDQYNGNFHNSSHLNRKNTTNQIPHEVHVEREVAERDHYATNMPDEPINADQSPTLNGGLMSASNGAKGSTIDDGMEKNIHIYHSEIYNEDISPKNDGRQSGIDPHLRYNDRYNRNVDGEGIHGNHRINASNQDDLERKHKEHLTAKIAGDVDDDPRYPADHDDRLSRPSIRVDGLDRGLQANKSGHRRDNYGQNNYSNYDRNPDEDWKLSSEGNINATESGRDTFKSGGDESSVIDQHRRPSIDNLNVRQATVPSSSIGEKNAPSSNANQGVLKKDENTKNYARSVDLRNQKEHKNRINEGSSLQDIKKQPTGWNNKVESFQKNEEFRHNGNNRNNFMTAVAADESKCEGRRSVDQDYDKKIPSHESNFILKSDYSKSLPQEDRRGRDLIGGDGASSKMPHVPLVSESGSVQGGRNEIFRDKTSKESGPFQMQGLKTNAIEGKQVASRNFAHSASRDWTREAEEDTVNSSSHHVPENQNSSHMLREEINRKETDSEQSGRRPESAGRDALETNGKTLEVNQIRRPDCLLEPCDDMPGASHNRVDQFQQENGQDAMKARRNNIDLTRTKDDRQMSESQKDGQLKPESGMPKTSTSSTRSQNEKITIEERSKNPRLSSNSTKRPGGITIEDFNLDLPMTLSRKVRKSKPRLDRSKKSSDNTNRLNEKPGFNGLQNTSSPGSSNWSGRITKGNRFKKNHVNGTYVRSDQTIISEDSIEDSKYFFPNGARAPTSNIPRRVTEPHSLHDDSTELPPRRRGTAPHSYSNQVSSGRRNGRSFEQTDNNFELQQTSDPSKSISTKLAAPQHTSAEVLDSKVSVSRRSTEPHSRSLEAKNLRSASVPRRASDTYPMNKQKVSDRTQRSSATDNKIPNGPSSIASTSVRRRHQPNNLTRTNIPLDRSSHTTGHILDRNHKPMDFSGHSLPTKKNSKRRASLSHVQKSSEPQNWPSTMSDNYPMGRNSPEILESSPPDNNSAGRNHSSDGDHTVIDNQRKSGLRLGTSSKNSHRMSEIKGGKERLFVEPPPYGRSGAKYIKAPCKYTIAKTDINLDSWLEHCREPLAIQKVMKRRQRNNKGRPQTKHKDYLEFKGSIKSLVLSEKDVAEREHRVLFNKSVSKYKVQEPNKKSCIVVASRQLATMKKEMNIEQEKNLRGDKSKRRKSIGIDDDDTLENALLSHHSFPKDIFKVISLLHGNDRCADCGKRFLDRSGLWASVTFGCLLCKECAFRHVSNEKKIKQNEILKPINNGNWTFPDILSMVEGGNGIFVKNVGKSEKGTYKGKRKNCIFNGDVDIDEETFRKAYCGNAASTYRKTLSQRVDKAITSKNELR